MIIYIDYYLHNNALYIFHVRYIFRFSVVHVLSDASETWSGLQGRINGELLHSFLPTRSPQEDPKCFAFVCGPTAFTLLARG